MVSTARRKTTTSRTSGKPTSSAGRRLVRESTASAATAHRCLRRLWPGTAQCAKPFPMISGKPGRTGDATRPFLAKWFDGYRPKEHETQREILGQRITE